MNIALSRLFPPTAGGKEKGKCIICGFESEKGFKPSFSDNFTSWAELEQGEIVCEHCYTLIKNQDYRRKSWIATKKGIHFLKKDDILKTLLCPPDPPFAIYITKTGKKQGFLKLINRVSFSRENYFIAFDDRLIFINRTKLEELTKIAERARKLGFSKAELLQGPKPHRWEYEELCMKIEELRHSPMWEVVVHAIR